MKAVLLKKTGGIDSLEYTEIADRDPQAGEVCVRLKAAAINRRDVSLRKRSTSAAIIPFVPGSDGSGVIESLGPGVTGFSEGQAVVINPALDWGASLRCPGTNFRILGGPDNGTYAEKIIIPAENLFPKPERLSFQQAAACPVGLLTAWRALVTLAEIKPGERILIPGAGSGVSTFALQIGKLCGCIVYTTSSSNDKMARALALGADAAVNYTDPDWVGQIKHLSGGSGFDVILDSVGTPTFGTGLELLAPGGRMVTFGATVDARVELNVRHIYSTHLQILGTTLGSPWEFAAALRAVESGGIEPVIDQVFLLPEAGKAQMRLEEGLQFGKIILEIS